MDKFNEIVLDVLHLDPNAITDTMSPKDVPDWDSMNYLLFIAEIEKAFETSFSMDDVLNAQNLGDIKKLLRARGKLV